MGLKAKIKNRTLPINQDKFQGSRKFLQIRYIYSQIPAYKFILFFSYHSNFQEYPYL